MYNSSVSWRTRRYTVYYNTFIRAELQSALVLMDVEIVAPCDIAFVISRQFDKLLNSIGLTIVRTSELSSDIKTTLCSIKVWSIIVCNHALATDHERNRLDPPTAIRLDQMYTHAFCFSTVMI